MKLLITALFIPLCFARDRPTKRSVTDNVIYKLAHEGWGENAVLGQSKKKSVRIDSGYEGLLQTCMSDTEHWEKDKFWGRMAHTHPFTSFSCREKASPSMHLVARWLPDGTRKVEAHLDGNGPQKTIWHLDEFVLHKLTLRDNNQDVMRDNLERQFSRSDPSQPEPFITDRERTMLFIHETIGIGPLAGSVGNGVFRHYVHQAIWPSESHYMSFENRVEGSLIRRTLKNGIEFGVATWRHEDTRFVASKETTLGKRLKYAVVHTFIVPTPNGREFAYARFAGVFGKTAIMDQWDPWKSQAPHITRQLSMGTVGLLSQSLTAEFWPEFKRKFFHKK